MKSSALLSCLAWDWCPFVEHHRSIHAYNFCWSLAISPNMDFSQCVYKSCCHPMAAMILVIYVDNNGIRHNCQELVQEFEKSVVMAMNPGANFDSLPILTIQIISLCRPSLHLSWRFLTLSIILCYSSALLRVTLFAHLQSNACSSLACHFFCSAIYLVSHDCNSSWCWGIVCSCLLSSVYCLSCPLCISVELLTKIMSAARWPAIFSSLFLMIVFFHMSFAQKCHILYTIDYLSERGYQSHYMTLACVTVTRISHAWGWVFFQSTEKYLRA